MINGRYENILQPTCARALWDSVLLDLGDIVVTPTLGSIIPSWVLAIPKAGFRNFSEWAAADRVAPLQCIARIAQRLSCDAGRLIWFEHGSNRSGSATGCGVDHAHIHILLEPTFTFPDFERQVGKSSSLDWTRGFGNPYRSIEHGKSYLVTGCANQYLLAQSVESAGSQYFRRIVATLSNKSSAWDYRTHPHLKNVAITVSHYLDAKRLATGAAA